MTYDPKRQKDVSDQKEAPNNCSFVLEQYDDSSTFKNVFFYFQKKKKNNIDVIKLKIRERKIDGH